MSDWNDWLKNLKLGDEVIVMSSNRLRLPRIETVDRALVSQVIVGGRRFWRQSGHENVSSPSRYSHWLAPATEERKARVEAAIRFGERELAEALATFKNIDWQKEPDEVVLAVFATYKEVKDK